MMFLIQVLIILATFLVCFSGANDDIKFINKTSKITSTTKFNSLDTFLAVSNEKMVVGTKGYTNYTNLDANITVYEMNGGQWLILDSFSVSTNLTQVAIDKNIITALFFDEIYIFEIEKSGIRRTILNFTDQKSPLILHVKVQSGIALVVYKNETRNLYFVDAIKKENGAEWKRYQTIKISYCISTFDVGIRFDMSLDRFFISCREGLFSYTRMYQKRNSSSDIWDDGSSIIKLEDNMWISGARIPPFSVYNDSILVVRSYWKSSLTDLNYYKEGNGTWTKVQRILNEGSIWDNNDFYLHKDHILTTNENPNKTSNRSRLQVYKLENGTWGEHSFLNDDWLSGYSGKVAGFLSDGFAVVSKKECSHCSVDIWTYITSEDAVGKNETNNTSTTTTNTTITTMTTTKTTTTINTTTTKTANSTKTTTTTETTTTTKTKTTRSSTTTEL